MASRPTKRKAEEALWEEQKATITRLFVTEDRTMKEISDILATDHEFPRT